MRATRLDSRRFKMKILSAVLWSWSFFGLIGAQITTPTSTTSSECNDCTRYGACKPPVLNPPEKHPLIVTKIVTSTAVLITNQVNTLTVAAPFYTETTTIMIRSTMTSTEVVVASILTTTTQTFFVSIFSTLTKELVDERIDFVITTGVTTVGPYSVFSERISTQIFTSYILATATRVITQVSKSTKTTSTTSIVYIYRRLTESAVATVFNTFYVYTAFSTSIIRVTFPVTPQSAVAVATTITADPFVSYITTGFNSFTVAQVTNLEYFAVPYTATQYRDTAYYGVLSGTVSVLTPAVTELIN